MIRARLLGAMTASIALASSACAAPPPIDEPVMCNGTGQRSDPAGAAERWVLGAGSRYPADLTIQGRADELRHSQRARRAVAWEAVARTLAPLPLARSTAVQNATVPRFRTWYDRDDLSRTFQRVYEGLGAEGRAAQAHFTESALDEAFGWNANFVTTLDTWNQARLDAYASGLDSSLAIAAVSGLQRVALSPDAARHVMSSYSEVLRCIAEGSPPSFVDTPPETSQRLAREPISIGPCGTQMAGPFFVATGGTLHAYVDGANAQNAEVRVLEGGSDTATAAVRCTMPGSRECVVAGPGLFSVRVSTNGRGVTGALEVKYDPPTPAIAACLNGVFPASAATVALEWRRTDIGFVFPIYNTSAIGLQRRLAPDGGATWGEGDGIANPSETEAYTMRIPSGGSFRLAGMHIRTRELDHWLNITLWWSPAPNDDFGADRPDVVRALGAPWTSYKMCVATDFDEQDPDPAGGFAETAPTLAAALRVVHEGRGGPSWCSNPYIDAGPGLVRSNCVGCHQHAMSGVRPADIQTDPVRYPWNGRMRLRNNYPSDQFWGLDGGDQYAAVLAETVAYWRSMQ